MLTASMGLAGIQLTEAADEAAACHTHSPARLVSRMPPTAKVVITNYEAAFGWAGLYALLSLSTLHDSLITGCMRFVMKEIFGVTGPISIISTALMV